MAARCTHYLKPLLEAGTQGTRGSASVFVPHVTEGYQAPASAAPGDGRYAVCTVRHFPSTAGHTLQVGSGPAPPHAQASAAGWSSPDPPAPLPPQWARDEFEGLFCLSAETINSRQQ